jgi:hypothetical protein
MAGEVPSPCELGLLILSVYLRAVTATQSTQYVRPRFSEAQHPAPFAAELGVATN